jgi:inner membrane transporter RhtA
MQVVQSRRLWQSHLAPSTGSWGRARAAAASFPPTGLAILSILSVQLGAATAKNLFGTLGAGGAVFLRIAFAAVVLLAIWRPRIRGYARRDYAAVIVFGLVIAGMNAAFYASIARLPLGVAVTLEFTGPLAVAIIGSRRRLDLLWVALAGSGIALLAPVGGLAFDGLGVVLALTAGAGWAGYILLNVRVGRVFPGATGLAMSMGVAALAVIPLGLADSAPLARDPGLLLSVAVMALLSTIIPFSLEHAALKRLSARTFGILMSLEPSVAAIIGLVALREAIGGRAVLALIFVTLATVGSSYADLPSDS